MFETLTKELIPAHAVGKLDWSEIQGCVVDILSAKNDKKHKGNRLYFGLADMTDPKPSLLHNWNVMEVYKNGKTSEGKIFLLRSGLESDIKADILQFVLEVAGAAI